VPLESTDLADQKIFQRWSTITVTCRKEDFEWAGTPGSWGSFLLALSCLPDYLHNTVSPGQLLGSIENPTKIIKPLYPLISPLLILEWYIPWVPPHLIFELGWENPRKLPVYDRSDRKRLRSEFSHPEVVILLTLLSYYYGGLCDDELFDTLTHVLKSDQSQHPLRWIPEPCVCVSRIHKGSHLIHWDYWSMG